MQATTTLTNTADSKGIKAEGERTWSGRKHGGHNRRIWRKIHIGIEEETLEVRALKVTGYTAPGVPGKQPVE